MTSSETYIKYIGKKMIFQLQGQLKIDETKPTIAFYDKGEINGFTHIYGPARVIKEELKKNYNIIEIGAGCKLENNYYEIKRSFKDSLLRKADSPEDYIEKNSAKIDAWLDESFEGLPELDYIILGTDDFFRLPLTTYTNKAHSEYLMSMQNEFFDYVGDDEEMLQKIDEVNDKVIKNWDKLVSPIAFSTCDYSIFMRSINHIHKMGKLKHKVIGFSIDPAIYTPFFDKLGVPADFFYFAEDKRGTRNFKQLDISQLQHIIFDNKFKPDTLDDWGDDEPVQKTGNFFFAGTIFQEKGSRKDMWDEFLKDIKSDDCSYFIPLRKNGIIKVRNGRSERAEDILAEHDELADLYNEVKDHKNFKGSLLPSELNDKTARFKYGMVFRCVSINDSLNFRPVLYSYMDIVPFLDYQYDPAYLQIPKNIQDKLVVRSASDIDEKIKFFNDNPSERELVLKELNELFHVQDYINNPEEMIKKQIDKIFN